MGKKCKKPQAVRDDSWLNCTAVPTRIREQKKKKKKKKKQQQKQHSVLQCNQTVACWLHIHLLVPQCGAHGEHTAREALCNG